MLLVLESTCDETAAALIDEQLQVRGSSVATQDAVSYTHLNVAWSVVF